MSIKLPRTLSAILLGAALFVTTAGVSAQDVTSVSPNFRGIWSSQNCTDNDAKFLVLRGAMAFKIDAGDAQPLRLILEQPVENNDWIAMKLDDEHGFMRRLPGDPTALEITFNRASQAEAEASLPAGARGDTPEPDPEFLELMEQLRTTVAERPNDIRGHELLARNEAAIGNFSAAHEVQQRLLNIKGENATASDYAAYADMLILAAGGYVSHEAEEALIAALNRDPHNGTARYYWGLMAAQNDRPDFAFDTWIRLLREGPVDAPWIAPIRGQIESVAMRADIHFEMPEVPETAVETDPSAPADTETLDGLYTESWNAERFNACAELPPSVQAIYGEILAVLTGIDAAGVACESGPQRCMDALFSVADVHADGALNIAEISRMFRVLTQISAIEQDTGQADAQVGLIAASVPLAPILSHALISSNDYNGDDALSLEEILHDRVVLPSSDMSRMLVEAESRVDEMMGVLEERAMDLGRLLMMMR